MADSDSPSSLPIVWTEAYVSKFWDYHAKFAHHHFAYQHSEAIARTVATLKPPPARILDYASGPGFLIPQLLQHGYRVTGADVSPASIVRMAAENAGRSGYEGAFNIADLASQAGVFDLILMAELVEHLTDSQLAAVFADARRLLRPEGYLFITTPNDEALAENIVYCPSCDHTFHRWQHVRSWTAETLTLALHSHDFAPERIQTTNFGLRSSGNRLLKILAGVKARLLRRKPPHLWCLARRV